MHDEKSAFLEVIASFPRKAQVELLQMFFDQRPVAEVCVIPKFRDKMLPALERLRESGFCAVEKERGRGVIEVWVAKCPALAEEVVTCQDSQRYGELMGFPSSAIAAFVKGEKFRLSEREVEDLVGFHNHVFWLRFSKDHPEDAIEYLRRSYKLLLESAEHLIDEMLPRGEDPVAYKRKVREFVYKA